MPENFARDWSGTDAVPRIARVEDVGSWRRWRLTVLLAALNFSSMRSMRGGGKEYCHHYEDEEGDGEEEGDEKAYEEAYEDAAPSFASSHMSGSPLVREDVARRPSSPLAVDESTTARDRSIDDGQGANSAKGDDDDDDDDDSSFATRPPRPCNPTADVRRGFSSCGRGGCAWGEGGGGVEDGMVVRGGSSSQ